MILNNEQIISDRSFSHDHVIYMLAFIKTFKNLIVTCLPIFKRHLRETMTFT